MTDPIIETEGLTRYFKKIKAVDRLTLTVEQGTIFCFLGPNGAGKTTTLNLLIGLITPTSGSSRVLGYDSQKEADKIREHIGVLLEDHGLYEHLTAYDNLEYYARIYRLSALERNTRIRELMQKLGIWERRHQKVKEWSKGMKQKLALCRSMLHRPQILFLDEPTAGLDPGSAKMVRDEILKMAAEENITVFMNTHNLDEAERISDEIGIINKGRLIAKGNPKLIREKMSIPRVVVKGNKFPEGIESRLANLPFVNRVSVSDNTLDIELKDLRRSSEVNRFLVEIGVDVEEMRRETSSLEEIFLTLVEEDAASG